MHFLLNHTINRDGSFATKKRKRHEPVILQSLANLDQHHGDVVSLPAIGLKYTVDAKYGKLITISLCGPTGLRTRASRFINAYEANSSAVTGIEYRMRGDKAIDAIVWDHLTKLVGVPLVFDSVQITRSDFERDNVLATFKLLPSTSTTRLTDDAISKYIPNSSAWGLNGDYPKWQTQRPRGDPVPWWSPPMRSNSCGRGPHRRVGGGFQQSI